MTSLIIVNKCVLMFTAGNVCQPNRDKFACGNGLCIDLQRVGDGDDDCLNQADERKIIIYYYQV